MNAIAHADLFHIGHLPCRWTQGTSNSFPNNCACYSPNSGQVFNTDSAGATATWPKPQILVCNIVSPSSGSTFSAAFGSDPFCTPSRISTAFCDPTRQGTHLPHDSLRKNLTTFVASASMSVPSAMTTSAPEPSIEPAFCNAAKSSGTST